MYSENMDRLYSLIDNTIQIVKKISKELRPPILDSMSITEAIEWQGESFHDKTGVNFSLDTSSTKIKLDEQRSISIFRIFQECLTNIARHSEASQIEVVIKSDDQFFEMRVKDDGKGMMQDEFDNETSLGIMGMKERALMWGGDVKLISEKDCGTEVIITINL